MTRKYLSLIAGVATAALLVGAPSAFAQVPDITQGATNSENVTNGGTSATITFSTPTGLPNGASMLVGATGAVSAASVTAINQNFSAPGFGTVLQGAVNSGDISNTGSTTIGGGANGLGSSMSVSASGAAAAVSITGIGGSNATFGALNVGNIDQGSLVLGPQALSNSGKVTNSGYIESSTNTLGNGASASISATGAVGQVSVTSIAADSFGAISFGTVDQKTSNTGEIQNTNTHFIVGDLTGSGASASVSATGAAASVSIVSIGNAAAGTTTNDVSFGAITQQVTNSAGGAGVSNTGGTVTVGDLAGAGAGVSITATGSMASVNATSIASKGADASHVFDSISSTSTNNKAVDNTGIIVAGLLGGNGSSASISATGAASSFFSSSIADTTVGSPTANSITQVATNNAGAAVTNNGSITIATGSTGIGSTASVSALGAGSFVSFRSVK